MKVLKRILAVMILSLISLSASAQVWQFRSEAYSQRVTNSYGQWGNWSKWQKCNVNITINLNNDLVTIYSNRTQYYQVTSYTGTYMDNGTQCVDYKFYDQDGDKGTMTLAMKPNGQSEIYIRFANIQWAYVVVRTY